MISQTNKIGESSRPVKIAQLSRPPILDEELLFYGGRLQIDTQRRDESISRKREFERPAPARETRPVWKATADRIRRSNPLKAFLVPDFQRNCRLNASSAGSDTPAVLVRPYSRVARRSQARRSVAGGDRFAGVKRPVGAARRPASKSVSRRHIWDRERRNKVSGRRRVDGT
jgi:hypothetical protein